MLILNAMWKELKIVINNNTSHTKKYQDHIPNSFAYKFVCVDINLVNKLCFIEVKIHFINSLMQFLKSKIIVEERWMNILIRI